jgi:hypothetical protein
MRTLSLASGFSLMLAGLAHARLKRIVLGAAFLVAALTSAGAMNFTWHDQTVHAVGPIEKGDAVKFAALPKFNILELDSPGRLVDEALSIAKNMDARGGIRTAVKPGAECASACATALFVSGATRIVYMGGRLGMHSCAMGGIPDPECNTKVAENALAHGVPWGAMQELDGVCGARCAGRTAEPGGCAARTLLSDTGGPGFQKRKAAQGPPAAVAGALFSLHPERRASGGAPWQRSAAIA